MKTYKLNSLGRKMTWSEFTSYVDGVVISNESISILVDHFGPMRLWGSLSLGELADANPYAGRSMARYLYRRCGRGDLTLEIF